MTESEPVAHGGGQMQRSMGVAGATGVGVGAIVGGGILALAGVAFAATGPAAMLAFALNGVIAVLTALSFAELSTQFPHSGGTYAFAKRVLSVEAAFTVGWVAWFASIGAGVLYAYGFGVFAVMALEPLWQHLFGQPPSWLTGKYAVQTLAVGATLAYTTALARSTSGGGHWPSVGKVIAFAILIGGGLWALTGSSPGDIRDHLTPFFTQGPLGLFRAMGYTFIALQGFDLIAAVAGEIRRPEKTIPRAMLLSLGIALGIYLPLLFIITTVGVEPGKTIMQTSSDHPESIVAVAALEYLGPFGYWVVIIAALLSMLSALHANLLAGSRIALAMAKDRVLPHRLEVLHERFGTPVSAVLVTMVLIVALLLVVPDVAAIGAVSSLIFLILFAFAHRIGIMARMRGGVVHEYFRVPLFPVVQVLGLITCGVLAVFQGISVPSAGIIACVWLAGGGVLYATMFARRARALDASSEALDADILRLRGRNPLVLVPIANPQSAEAMVEVANALAPTDIGRVLLLTVVATTDPAQPVQAAGRQYTPSTIHYHERYRHTVKRLHRSWEPGDSPESLAAAQDVHRQAMSASFAHGLRPEALTTIAEEPWEEIVRVARIHQCESMLLGLSNLTKASLDTPLEHVISHVGCDVVILRADADWQLQDVHNILVPIGGRGDHDELRARLLSSLCRTMHRKVTVLRIVPGSYTPGQCERDRKKLLRIAHDEIPGQAEVVIARNDNVAEELTRHAAASDLTVLGLQRLGRRRKVIGDVTMQVAHDTTCAMLMICRRG